MEIKKCAKAADPSIRQTNSSELTKPEAMWFFISDNFDLKLETLIMLDKIESSHFSQRDLQNFISSIETKMLKDLNESTTVEENTNDQIHLGESIRFDEQQGGGDLYNTVKLDNYRTGKPQHFKNEPRRRDQMGNQSKDLFKKSSEGLDNFEGMSSREKKQWLLEQIMELKISSKVQNQLVGRIEGIMQIEEDKQRDLKKQLQMLEDKIQRLKKNKSQNQMDEGLILEELEAKEKQLIQLESEYKTVKDKLVLLEKEKGKMEETFVGEVLGLQTGLDQKLMQIESLDKRNRELSEAKEDLENMVDEYKKYSEGCKQRTKEVEQEKNAQITDLKKEINWLKQTFDQKRENLLEKVEVEKLALEQTIKELMFNNKVRVTRTCRRILSI